MEFSYGTDAGDPPNGNNKIILDFWMLQKANPNATD